MILPAAPLARSIAFASFHALIAPFLAYVIRECQSILRYVGLPAVAADAAVRERFLFETRDQLACLPYCNNLLPSHSSFLSCLNCNIWKFRREYIRGRMSYLSGCHSHPCRGRWACTCSAGRCTTPLSCQRQSSCSAGREGCSIRGAKLTSEREGDRVGIDVVIGRNGDGAGERQQCCPERDHRG